MGIRQVSCQVTGPQPGTRVTVTVSFFLTVATVGRKCSHMTIAALYVDTERGPYAKMPGVDPWGVERDATLYSGPNPVVAHPPCAPWGRMRRWASAQRDGAADCGPIAVDQVRRFGGVLEHPAGSALWGHCGMPRPGHGKDAYGGYTVCVDQCDWGHPCAKKTWLYIVGVEWENMVDMMPLAKGVPTHSIRGKLPEIPKRLRHVTPPSFALFLVALANRSKPLPPTLSLDSPRACVLRAM